MAEGGNDSGDYKDNLGNAGNTEESQCSDEFEVQFTDHRKMIPGRDRLATSLFPKSPRQTYSTARNLSTGPSKRRWGNRFAGFALS